MSGRHLLTDDDLRDAMVRCHTLAVIGMKPAPGPASSVPLYMRRHGYDTYPVNPKHQAVDGLPCVDVVTEVEVPIDMVVIFRRPEFIDAHADEILALDPLPLVVWMQLGIRNERAAKRLMKAGIDVVQSKCLAVEHPRLIGSP